jgi:hypothetical protein
VHLLTATPAGESSKRFDSNEHKFATMSNLTAEELANFVCTLEYCDVAEYGYVHYLPSMAGNILFLVRLPKRPEPLELPFTITSRNTLKDVPTPQLPLRYTAISLHTLQKAKHS